MASLGVQSTMTSDKLLYKFDFDLITFDCYGAHRLEVGIVKPFKRKLRKTALARP